jgi:hypothetical protein
MSLPERVSTSSKSTTYIDDVDPSIAGPYRNSELHFAKLIVKS